MPEAGDDVVFDAAEHSHELGEYGDVVFPRRTGQHRGVLGRQQYNVLVASTSTTPAVTIAPSHSRT